MSTAPSVPIVLPGDSTRPLSELTSTGILWALNVHVFHPRGFALALHYSDHPDTSPEPIGWSLLGDGTEPWVMDNHAGDERFEAFNALLADARKIDVQGIEQDAPEWTT